METTRLSADTWTPRIQWYICMLVTRTAGRRGSLPPATLADRNLFALNMASSENSQLVSDFDTISTLNYCACACMALLLYYNITTFDEEAKHYTRPVLTGASVLYLLNRYLPLAVVIYNGPFWSLSRNKVRLALLSRT
ncbi:hypothetical protein FKP32DRAFT_659362 [Trametes sanguinea]|nr:hypothetical protein FKP32DRAFT_659362 [Trametes sanguinea]